MMFCWWALEGEGGFVDKQLEFASGLTGKSLYFGLFLREEREKCSEQASSTGYLQVKGPQGCFLQGLCSWTGPSGSCSASFS